MIILTRSEEANRALMARLPDLDALSLPALALSPLSFSLPSSVENGGLFFFASGFAVQCFFDQLQDSNFRLRSSAALLAVGQSTADRIKACLNTYQSQHALTAGQVPRIVTPERFGADSAALIEVYRHQLSRQMSDPASCTAWIVRSHRGREELPSFLRSMGHPVEYLAVYERRLCIWPDAVMHDLSCARTHTSIVWLMTSNLGVDALMQNAASQPKWLDGLSRDYFVVVHDRISRYLHQKLPQLPATCTQVCAPNLDALAACLRQSHMNCTAAGRSG